MTLLKAMFDSHKVSESVRDENSFKLVA
jgi:hypothetical protein